MNGGYGESYGGCWYDILFGPITVPPSVPLSGFVRRICFLRYQSRRYKVECYHADEGGEARIPPEPHGAARSHQSSHGG